MKNFLIFTIFLILSTFIGSVLAQPPAPCTNGTQNTCKCNTSPVLCSIEELDGYTYAMTTYNHYQDGPYNPGPGTSYMCPGYAGTTSHNPTWFKFPAWCTELELEVCYANCVDGPGCLGCCDYGIQAAVYSECFGCPPPDCYGPSWAQNSQDPAPYTYAVGCDTDVAGCVDNSCRTVQMSGLELGKLYYFLVDGCCGSACQITINVYGACGAPEIEDFIGIDGPTNICLGTDTVEYYHPKPNGATKLFWYLDGVLVQSGSNNLDKWWKKKWTIPGTYELCFDASQEPCIPVTDPPDPTCITITVTSGLNVSISGPAGYCQGQSITLDAGPGYTSYIWSNGSNNQTIQVNSPGTYTVTVTNINGCIDSASHNVVQLPSPSASASSNSPVCVGGTILLNAAGGVSYSWSGPAGFNSNLQNPIISNAQPINAGIYSVTVSNPEGCTSVANTNVVINVVPIGSAGNNGPLCSGVTLELTASGGVSYTWSGPSGFQSNQQNPTIPNVTPANGGTYHVTVTNAQGCVHSVSTTVVIHALPNAMASSNAPVCTGATIQLSASGGNSYQWSGPAGFSSNMQNPTIPNAGLGNDGVYIVTVTGNGGCTSTSSTTVQVFLSPEPMITGSTSFCEGGYTILSAGFGYSSYIWSNGADTEDIYVDNPGTYSVTVTDINGCTGHDEVEVVQGQFLSPQITGDTVLCNGVQGVLNAGAGFQFYIWNTGHTTQTITITSPGNYSVTVSDQSGCVGEDAVVVSESVGPNGMASANSPVCTGQTILLSSLGGTSYQWNGPNGFNSFVQNPSISNASGVHAGTYVVTVTDAEGCKDTAHTHVVVQDGVTLTATATIPNCPGDTLFLFASGGTSYLWSGPNGFSSQQQNPFIPNVKSNASGIYVVTDPNAPGCVANDTIQITIPSGPEPKITGNFNICKGEEATLNAGPGFNFYVWSTGQTSQIITTSTPGIYWVIVSDGSGCLGRDTATVVLSNNLNPSITGKSAVCVGDSSILNAGSGYATYFWNTGDTIPSIIVSTTGEYSVTVTNNTGCEGYDTLSFKVYDFPRVDFQVLSEQCKDSCDGMITLIPQDSGYVYKWSNGDSLEIINNLCSGVYLVTITSPGGCFTVDATFVPAALELKATINAQDNMLHAVAVGGAPAYKYLWSNGSTDPSIPYTPGMHSVTVTDAHGCTKTATILITSLDKKDSSSAGMVVYPNPASSHFIIEPLDGTIFGRTLDYRILSMNGTVVQSGIIEETSRQYAIITNNWPSGSYALQLSSGSNFVGSMIITIQR